MKGVSKGVWTTSTQFSPRRENCFGSVLNKIGARTEHTPCEEGGKKGRREGRNNVGDK